MNKIAKIVGKRWPKLVSKFTSIRESHASISVTEPKILEPEYDGVRPFEDIPGPKGLPYLGIYFKYKYGPFKPDKYHDALLSMHRQYGKIFKETIVGKTIVHLFDPDYISTVYQQEGKIPHVPPLMETTQMYRKTRDMSPGLGNTNGEEWYRLRSAVQQMMMRPKAVSMFLPQVNEVMDDFIRRIKHLRDPVSGEVPDFKNEISKWNIESSAITCFETRLNCLEAQPGSLEQSMLDANSEIFELSTKLWFGLPWFKLFQTPTWNRLVAAEDLFFSNGQKLVDQTVSKIKTLVDSNELEEGQYGFLTYLMGKRELSYKDLSIITLSLFSDGLKTTVPSLIGQMYCLAKNPEKQQALYDSIREVAPHADQPITNKIINDLPYLKACLKEGFRFFPINTDVTRFPQKDLVIGGYHIPTGSHISLNNNMLLRLPEYFDDPESYRPERWLRSESAETVHPYLLLPFSFGPRTCAGRRFAEQEMQVMLIRLLQNFRIEWPHREEMGQRFTLLLSPDVLPKFRLVPRH